MQQPPPEPQQPSAPMQPQQYPVYQQAPGYYAPPTLSEEELTRGYKWALYTAVCYIIPLFSIFAPIVNAVFLVKALTSRMPDNRRYPGTGWIIGFMVFGALLYLLFCAYIAIFVVTAMSET